MKLRAENKRMAAYNSTYSKGGISCSKDNLAVKQM